MLPPPELNAREKAPSKSQDTLVAQKPAGQDKIQQLWGPAALDAHRDEKRHHQARHAEQRQKWIDNNGYFYDKLKSLLRFTIEPGKRVLNVRCQTGWFLNVVEPEKGVGVEISQEMVEVARRLYPQFDYVAVDAEKLFIDEKFDYILLNSIEDTVEISPVLQNLAKCCDLHSRLVIYSYNHRWAPILKWAERLGIKWPTQEPNWLSEHDIRSALQLSGFEWLKTYRSILLPLHIPILSAIFNDILAHIPGIDRLCLVKLLVARPSPKPMDPSTISVSIIVPCKNEQGNIKPAVERIPELGKHTEIIFCDDKSTDGTGEAVIEMQKAYPDRDIKLIQGPGICKADNVWTGFDAASGDVLMILDGDLAVMPEELPLFFRAMVENTGEFINGSRLVYPIPKDAMSFTNLLGNKAFSIGFSLLLGQRVKDTLCGTKVLWRSDWERIRPTIGKWGGKDLWGDFVLLFGATFLNLRILDLPIHYQQRTYGTTKMLRVFKNGMNMARIYLFALFKLRRHVADR